MMNWTVFTIWSRGRLLGDSTLGFVPVFDKHRMGWFNPTPQGLALMPLILEERRALLDYGQLLLRGKDIDQPPLKPEALRDTPEYADLLAAETHRDALQLELRGPDDKVIATEWIDIRDTHAPPPEPPTSDHEPDLLDECEHLSELVEEALEERLEWRKEDLTLEPTGPVDLPRYQVQVMLASEWSIP